MKRKVKSILSVILTMCMLVTMVPINTMASDFDAFSDGTFTEPAEPSVPEQDVPADDAVIGDDITIDEVIPEEENPVEGDASLDGVELGEAEFDDGEAVFGDGEMPELDPFSDGVVEAAAVDLRARPEGGTTYDQPFKSGTGGSTCFRIPAMVTLGDGTIVAATDARWNTTGDGGGLDTIVSRSTDGGKTWNYTFANYLGDNGNTWNGGSTAFIDPALATDGKTVYMVVDLFPAGYALNSANNAPVAGQNGFNNEGYLRLSNNNRKSYDCYLKDGQIYDSNSYAVDGYTVDAYFNIKGNGTNTNLFCADSPYQVYPTDYLYLTKSTDGGATWSVPTLINAKEPEEQTYLIGPGRGLVTSTGRIIFPCYDHTSGTEHTSFIYSDDKGVTWRRTGEFADYSSETTLVEANGKLYAFFRCSGTDYRDIPYYVSADNGTTWTRGPKNSQIDPCTSCQMNAITYSKKIDGQTAILLSCPTGNSRNNGKIHVALVNEKDNTLNWKYASEIISSNYSYSCLTELKDGTIGLLAETGNGKEEYYTYRIEDIAKGATIDGGEVTEEEKTVTDFETNVAVTAKGLTNVSAVIAEVSEIVTDYIAYNITPYIGETPYTEQATVTLPLSDALKAMDSNKLTGFVVNNNGTITEVAGEKTADGLFYTFVAPHFSVMGVKALAAEGEGGDTTPVTKEKTLKVGETWSDTIDGQQGVEGTYTTQDGFVTYTIKHNKTTTPGETTVESVTSLTNGNYLIGDGINWLTWDGTSLGNTNDPAQATEWTVTSSGSSYSIQMDGTYLTTSNSRGTENLTTSTNAKEWYWDSSNGFNYKVGSIVPRTYYLRYNNRWSVDRTNSNVGTPYVRTTTSGETSYTTGITFTGKTSGETSVTIGNTTYNITVEKTESGPDPEPQTIDVTVYVGQTKTITDTTGAYASNGVGNPDTSIATVTATNTSHTIAGETTLVNSITSGKQYLIENSRAELVLTDEANDAGLLLAGAVSAGSEELWTITQVSGGYTIQNANGKYLTIGNGTATLSDKETTLSAEYVISFNDVYGNFVNLNAFEIGFEHNYLNQYGGYTSTMAAGYYYPDAGSGWNIYEVTSAMEKPATDITIEGKAVGITTAVVGYTTYNITVKEVPETLDPDSTPFESGTGIGAGKVVTKLTTSVGVSFDLNLSEEFSGKTVEWEIGDSHIASVDQNGVVTGKAVGETVVTAIIDGVEYSIPVTVLKGSESNNGKLVNLYISEITDTTVYYSENCGTTLTEVREGEAIYVKYPSDSKVAMDFFGKPDNGYALTRMSATNAAGDYMALNRGVNPDETDFYTKAGAAGANQVGVFGADLVKRMIKAAQDAGCDGGMGFTRGPSDTNTVNSDMTFRSEKLPEITKTVVAIRKTNADGTKEVRKYEPGMPAVSGEEIFFEVTVKKGEYEDLIDFSNLRFTDSLDVKLYEPIAPNYPFIKDMYADTTEYMLKANSIANLTFDTKDKKSETYYVGYTVKPEDLDSTITNTVTLLQTYKSEYSSGNFEGSAEAEASISATSFKPEDVVVDFGLPVKIDFSGSADDGKLGDHRIITGAEVIKMAGVESDEEPRKLAYTNTTVTYVPEKVLIDYETVELTVKNNKNTENNNTFKVRFNIYPASNVMYEAEDFMRESSNSGVSWQKNSGNTESYELGGEYGRTVSEVYNSSSNECSNIGSYWASVSATQKVTKFLTTDFYGSMFDLIGSCGPDTGYVVAMIQGIDENGKEFAACNPVVVDTSYVDGNKTRLNQVPLAHMKLKSAVRYTVDIYGAYRAGTTANTVSTFSANDSGVDMGLYEIFDFLDRKGFAMDEIDMVYFDEGSSLAHMKNAVMSTYALDEETTENVSRPEGTYVCIDAFRVYDTETYKEHYTSTEKNVIYTNVLESVNDGFSAYIENRDGNGWTKTNYESAGGPQNEIYLRGNSAAAVFNVNTQSTLHISAKAVTGQPVIMVVNEQEISVKSNTEMYYDITKFITKDGTVAISIKGEGMLAIANLKSSTPLNQVTEATLATAFSMLTAPVEPEVPEIFKPEKLNAKANSKKTGKQKKVTVTVTASADVEYITVTTDGNAVEEINKEIVKHGKNKNYVFTCTDVVGHKEKPIYEVIAYNADGVASEPIIVKG